MYLIINKECSTVKEVSIEYSVENIIDVLERHSNSEKYELKFAILHRYIGCETTDKVNYKALILCNKIIKHKDNTIKVLKIGGITIGCGILILLLLK